MNKEKMKILVDLKVAINNGLEKKTPRMFERFFQEKEDDRIASYFSHLHTLVNRLIDLETQRDNNLFSGFYLKKITAEDIYKQLQIKEEEGDE